MIKHWKKIIIALGFGAMAVGAGDLVLDNQTITSVPVVEGEYWVYIKAEDEITTPDMIAGRSQKGDVVDIISTARGKGEYPKTPGYLIVRMKLDEATKAKMLEQNMEGEEGRQVSVSYRKNRIDFDRFKIDNSISKNNGVVSEMKDKITPVEKTEAEIFSYKKRAEQYAKTEWVRKIGRNIKDTLFPVAWANTVRYVDPDSAGGNGTTNALSGANAAYASLNLWEDARDGVLSDVEEVVVGSNGESHTADTTIVEISGWTTSATNYIYIHPDASSTHEGVWDNTKYRLVGAGADGFYTLIVSARYVRIMGLQIGINTTNGYGSVMINNYNTGSYFTLDSCIVTKTGGAKIVYAGIRVGDYPTQTRISNNLVYGLSTNGTGNFYIGSNDNATNYALLYNNTSYGGTAGFITSGNKYAVLTNNVSVGSVGASYQAVTWGAASDYNVSSDTSAPGTTVATNKTDYATYFTNYSGGDFHLTGTSASLLGIGGNSLAGTFTNDFEGDTRSNWDVGADEYVAVGGGGYVPNQEIIGNWYK